ncbi:uncharacterized protein C8A04DRAFT_26101 [Dichotomopilus funicola]|uniref:Uncharacterized protein n=1 Tax=Dichotomopilus funicola TaxID=1934379 RepID=A0AAN6ZPD3_9PEZI|nr:hypothetical protein C8A04DRAFT_26101 [Dichotomopilus funicola]
MDATDESPGLFKIPRHIRENIYRLVFGSGPKHQSEYIDRMGPHVPIKDLGLLSVSRRIHKEAIAVLYESVDLGADAQLALNYVQFILSKRRECSCKSSGDSIYGPCNWHPVLELLAASAAPISRVNVAFDGCNGGALWARDPPPPDSCRLHWDLDQALFWTQLPVLSSSAQICFIDPCPEYFITRLAQYFRWGMKGKIYIGGYRGCSVSAFMGKLIRPERAEQVVAVFPLLRLPVEIRHRIYKYALKWEYRPFWPIAPATFNPGIGLLSTRKEIAKEARPFLYRSLTIHGGVPLRDLDTFGSNITLTRRFNIQFSCFCEWKGDLEHQNHTLYDEHIGRVSASGDPFEDPTVSYPFTTVEAVKGQWAEALKRIQSLEANAEVAVIFQSCCRTARPAIPRGDGGSVNLVGPKIHSYVCASLENHFTDILSAACCHRSIQQIALWGNVPPSLAMRLLALPSTPDQSEAPLYLRDMSDAMRNYIGCVEEV